MTWEWNLRAYKNWFTVFNPKKICLKFTLTFSPSDLSYTNPVKVLHSNPTPPVTEGQNRYGGWWHQSTHTPTHYQPTSNYIFYDIFYSIFYSIFYYIFF